MPSLAKPLITRAIVETPATRSWRANATSPSVMHVFEGAANLVDDKAGVLSLVAHPLGAGPFTMVLQPERPQDGRRFRFNEWVESDSQVHVEGEQLSVGRLFVLLGNSELWDPVLPWAELRAHVDEFLARRERLQELLGRLRPPEALPLCLQSTWRATRTLVIWSMPCSKGPGNRPEDWCRPWRSAIPRLPSHRRADWPASAAG